ncbi:hypothetical protein Scep_009211 [Stephania cephalantha]|uniref:Uncharacterized protein n=1 Tax=Stephania cephalantha TaxID=152367 RepID=A0AAP0JV25_9MAGN
MVRGVQRAARRKAEVRRALRDGPTAVTVLEREREDDGGERGEREREIWNQREREDDEERERERRAKQGAGSPDAEPAARRGLAAELQQQRTNGATPAKAADARQQRWRRLSIGGAAAVADRRRGGCVGWCGCGRVGAGTTPATPAAAAERREEPAGREETAVRGERSRE